MSDTCTDPLGHRLNIAGYCVRCGSFVPLTATLRQHAEQLAAALIKVEWAQQMTRLKNGGTIYMAITCPCCGGEKDPPPGRAAHRAPPAGHAAECELARVLQAWREEPRAASKGQGEG